MQRNKYTECHKTSAIYTYISNKFDNKFNSRASSFIVSFYNVLDSFYTEFEIRC